MKKENLNKTNEIVSETKKKNDVIKVVGIVIGVIALFTLVFFASTLRDKGEKLEPIVVDTTVSEYFDLKKADGKAIILFASPDCPWCVKYKPIINKVSSDYKLPIYYVNTANMTRDEFNQVVADSPYMTSEGGFGTPLTLIVGNNEEVDYLDGKREYSDLVNFLKDNGVIE